MNCFKILSFIISFLTAFFLFFPSESDAGNFRIMPARLFLNIENKTETFRIISKDADKLTFQISAVKWTQDREGKDVYQATDEIIFFPKIVTVQKDEEVRVRIGYQNLAPELIEKSYRLFIRELPVSKSGDSRLKMAMNIGVPVFVSPVENRHNGVVEKIEIRAGEVLISVRNTGNSHFFVQKINAAGTDETGAEVFVRDINGWYVLPGVVKTFSAKISVEESHGIKKLVVAAQTDKSVLKAESELSETETVCHP